MIVGDLIPERLEQARSFGCETVDLRRDATLAEQIEQIVGEPEVDQAVDCVGFEARGHGKDTAVEQPATVLNSVMEVTRAGGGIGIPGLYVTGDPGGVDDNAKIGNLGIRIGLGWAKSHHFTTGQCPVMRYNRQLMQAILYQGERGQERRGDRNLARRRAAGLPGLRPRRGQEVHHRPARDDRRLAPRNRRPRRRYPTRSVSARSCWSVPTATRMSALRTVAVRASAALTRVPSGR